MLVAKSERLTRSRIESIGKSLDDLLASGVRLQEVVKELQETPLPSKHQLLYCSRLLEEWIYNDLSSDEDSHPEFFTLFELINNELDAIGVQPPWKYRAAPPAVA